MRILDYKKEMLERGYSLLAAYHGRGYATEAIQSMVRWAPESIEI